MAGKRYKAAAAAVDINVDMTVADAVAVIKKNATAKFDETIEIAMNLGVDPRHADQMVRGVCNLPNGTGRSVRGHPAGFCDRRGYTDNLRERDCLSV